MGGFLPIAEPEEKAFPQRVPVNANSFPFRKVLYRTVRAIREQNEALVSLQFCGVEYGPGETWLGLGCPMGRAVELNEASEQTSALPGILASEIQEALAEMMTSSPFRSSKQSQELLQYIVDKSLSGHAELLKERVIGIEVFGRRPDYDTNADPVVRARVAEVRKRLALYYQTEPGKAVRISVPHGSFRASFERIDRNSVPLSSAPSQGPELSRKPVESGIAALPHERMEHDVKPSSAGFRVRPWWILIAASVVILLLGVLHNFLSPESRAFNRFWSPIFDNPHAALIYVGGNAVYQLSPSYLDSYYHQHPPSQTEEMGFESYIQLPPGTKLDAQDLFPAKDTFITIGDVAAITKIESLLVHRNRQFDIRYGGDVTYGDLRQSPTILIGAHNNSWTLAMTGNLRYVFSGRSAIVDRSDPKKRWSAPASFTEDYAIVSRVIDSRTGTTVISVAGVGYAGTQSAAEFLTNPQSIAKLVRSLPKGWEKKNIEIVLHTTVTNQLPGAPDVVATYCW